MKNNKLLTLLISGVLLNTTAFANNDITNRNLIQASYEQTDYDEDLSLTGYSVYGSKSITDNIFITAEYVSLSDNIDIFFDDVGVDQTEISIGGGYTYELNNKAELFGRFSFAYSGEREHRFRFIVNT